MFEFDGGTIDMDLGERAFIRAVDELDDAHIDVGLFEGEPDHPDSEYNVVQIGAVHEFGTKPDTVPKIQERSYLRSTADEQREVYVKKMNRLAEHIQKKKGKVSAISLMQAVGEKMASDVRRKITKLKEPDISDATKARKGSTNPLIDTGHLRASIRSLIVVGKSEKKTPRGG